MLRTPHHHQDFVCLDRGVPADQAADYGDLIQFPLAGQALVMAYNIPGIPSTTNLVLTHLTHSQGAMRCGGGVSYWLRTTANGRPGEQVIERETLGLIWSGNITKWNDGRIQSSNLGITLPDEFITIGYEDSDVLTITEVVKRALESFSEEFRTALAAAGRLFAQMPPALSSRALRAGETTAQRINWLKVPRVHAHTYHRTTFTDSRRFTHHRRTTTASPSSTTPTPTTVASHG
jgi:hypothetical protein